MRLPAGMHSGADFRHAVMQERSHDDYSSEETSQDPEGPEVLDGAEAIPDDTPKEVPEEIADQFKTIPMVRADRVLTKRGLCTSRTEAAEFIRQGRVALRSGKKIKKNSEKIPINARLIITDVDGEVVEFPTLGMATNSLNSAAAEEDVADILRRAHEQQSVANEKQQEEVDVADLLRQVHGGDAAELKSGAEEKASRQRGEQPKVAKNGKSKKKATEADEEKPVDPSDVVIDVFASDRELSPEELDNMIDIMKVPDAPKRRETASSRAAKFANNRRALRDMKEVQQKYKRSKQLPEMDGVPIKRYSKKFKGHLRNKMGEVDDGHNPWKEQRRKIR